MILIFWLEGLINHSFIFVGDHVAFVSLGAVRGGVVGIDGDVGCFDGESGASVALFTAEFAEVDGLGHDVCFNAGVAVFENNFVLHFVGGF